MSIYLGTNKISNTGAVEFDDSEDITFTGTIVFDPDSGKTVPYFPDGLRIGANNSQNQLDYYEHGSWSPTSVGESAPTFENVSAHYVRVGEQVTLWGKIGIPTNSVAADLSIGSLPFDITTSTDHRVYGEIWAVRTGGTNQTVPTNGSDYKNDLPLNVSTTSSIRLTTTSNNYSSYSNVTIWFNFDYRTSS